MWPTCQHVNIARFWNVKVLALSAIGQSNVAVGSRCTEDYWPCSCHQLNTSTNQSRLVIHCNEARSVRIVGLMLRRTSSSDIHAFYMTLPEEQSRKQNQDRELNTAHFWEGFFAYVNVQNIHLTCPTNNFQLTFSTDVFSYASLSIEHIHVDNCDVTLINWSFLRDLFFLKRLTFSRIPNLQLWNLPELISLNTLNITYLSVIHDGFTPPSNTSMPYLTSLIIDDSKIYPESSIDEFLGRTLEHFLNQYRYLESVSMNGYQMGDSSLTHIFSMLSHETKRNNALRTLSLANNGLTRIPKLEVFPNLVTLILDKNNFTKLENYSLQRDGSQLRILSLSSCRIHSIEPAALEGESWYLMANEFHTRVLHSIRVKQALIPATWILLSTLLTIIWLDLNRLSSKTYWKIWLNGTILAWLTFLTVRALFLLVSDIEIWRKCPLL